MILIIIILLISFYVIFSIINNYYMNMVLPENFCYSNITCNGNKDSSLCISQSCRNCGLKAYCNKDSDCSPNNCINGCCDTL
jgi:hypothetical protein